MSDPGTEADLILYVVSWVSFGRPGAFATFDLEKARSKTLEIGGGGSRVWLDQRIISSREMIENELS